MLQRMAQVMARAVLPAGITLAFSLAVALAVPQPAFSQTSPFLTGATALEANILAWLTPIAVILVMALGGMAMANRISWGWCFGAILGIAIAFGAPQIVSWVRGMFGV
jgi:type IV secretion system protein VirB2